jgi:WD40 repeat protein
MGITTSVDSKNNSEGDVYAHIINPGKTRPLSGTSMRPGDTPILQKIALSPKAKIIRKLNHIDLWENFIKSQFMTFALTPAELQSLLHDTAIQYLDSKEKGSIDEVDNEIKEYLELINEICEKDHVKSIDFMAVVSSILLLNPIPIEIKIDSLFQFIQLNPMTREFNFEDFLVALTSFEKGISFALNKRSCSEAYMKDISSQWFTLADPLHRNLSLSNVSNNNSNNLASSVTFLNDQTAINNHSFFEFCTNRQLIVRRVIEGLAALDLQDNKNTNLQEVSDTLEMLKKPAAGGDEWMANPAWKKTAERMIPPSCKSKYIDAKPSSNLELGWIHGYRGFDCRNNVFFVNDQGQSSQIVYSAAGVSVVQDFSDRENWSNRKQYYFSEHGDDIISMATFKHPTDNVKTLIASGEIGKTPAVYLYSWTPVSQSNGVFESLVTMKGCHTKGVAQLAFSNDGSLLYSVGVEYSVAIYCTDQSNSKQFGKLVASGQGPKDRILHLCSFAGPADHKFYSCGEKHIILWSLDRGVLKQETCKLGGNKNKIFLSVCKIGGNLVIASTTEGDLFCLSETAVSPVTVIQGKSKGHGKSAINALTSSGEIFITGDKDGLIIVWGVTVTGLAVTLTAMYDFLVSSGFSGLQVTIKDNTPMSTKAVGSAAAAAATKPLPIRSLAINHDLNSIIIGTQTCEILEYRIVPPSSSFKKITDKTDFQKTLLTCGHYQGEVWGLSVRPINEFNYSEGSHYCTVGDDGCLWIWNADEHKPLACAALGGMARACAYSPDGLYVAVGYGGRLGNKKGKNIEDGIVKVLRAEYKSGKYDITQVAEIREAKQWISAIRFSPDGATLAVGSRDNSIYLYSVPNQYRRKAKFTKHNAGINQLDFSACGKYLQSCCR